MLLVARVVNAVAAFLHQKTTYCEHDAFTYWAARSTTNMQQKWLRIPSHTIKMIVVVDVNMYSPQIGQSDSRFRSMHLCFPLSDTAMHTLHTLQWKKSLPAP